MSTNPRPGEQPDRVDLEQVEVKRTTKKDGTVKALVSLMAGVEIVDGPQRYRSPETEDEEARTWFLYRVRNTEGEWHVALGKSKKLAIHGMTEDGALRYQPESEMRTHLGHATREGLLAWLGDPEVIAQRQQRRAELMGAALEAARTEGGELFLEAQADGRWLGDNPHWWWLGRDAYVAACRALGLDPVDDDRIHASTSTPYVNPRHQGPEQMAARELENLRWSALELRKRRIESERTTPDFDLRLTQSQWARSAQNADDERITYPEPLPEELRGWYAYTSQGVGHSIGVVTERVIAGREHLDLTQDVVGVPVRTVLRVGWRITPLGFVVVDLPQVPRPMKRTTTLTIECPPEDEELLHGAEEVDELLRDRSLKARLFYLSMWRDLLRNRVRRLFRSDRHL